MNKKLKVVSKPWGREVWFAYDNNKYVGKLIEVKKGKRLSLQYHQKKHETMYINKGEVKITLESDKGKLITRILKEGKAIEILPGRKHRIKALKNSIIFEVSTIEVDDVVRVEDDFGRN